MEKNLSACRRAAFHLRPTHKFLLCWLIGLLAGFIPAASHATNHQTRMDAIMAGLNGDPSIQFIEIVVNGNTQKDWGPQGSETESRAMLVFFDAAGTQIGQFKFPNDPPSGANTVLIATAAFTNLTGLRADIVMPPLLNPGSGKVCFKRNPANPFGFAVNLCLSYGSFPTNLTEGAGVPAPELLITGDPKALVRFQNFSFGDTTSRNADFRIGFPSPTNTSSQKFNFSVPGPKIQVSRLIDFGSQNIALGSTQPTSLAIANAGFSNAMSITSVTLMGTNTNQFSILTDSGQSVLGPAASRTLTLSFDPSSLGPKSAFLRILCNDTNEPVVDVALQGSGSDFNPCAVQNPTNAIAQNSASDAELVAPGVVYSNTTVNATRDGFSTCGNTTNSPDVWYKYVASANGTLTVNMSGSSFATVVSAHSGAPGITNNQIVCSQSLTVGFSVTNGADVFLRIAGVNGASGAFRMTLTGPPAFNFDKNTNGINDNCEIDFGDAPAPYPTLLANNGARHRATSGFFLGKKVDVESDGIPSALANGDNLNNTANDDDGVTFTGPLRTSLTTTVNVVASTNGVLNAWIDFNSDGDWSDQGEQIFLNRLLSKGTNSIFFGVPSIAVVTNRTFARFRFGATNGLTFAGLSGDGEVEDYAVEILAATNSTPSTVGVRIGEVMAGFNGDSTIQFVELEVNGDTNKFWGPQGAETAGRAMLVFSDAAGQQIGRFVFPSNAPPRKIGQLPGINGDPVLIATREFAELSGITPDFIMPPELMPVAGKVSFRNNPDNSHFNINIALSYGGNGYFGQTDGAGSANVNRLLITGASSLRRTQTVSFGLNLNSAFTSGIPSPVNAAGETFVFPPPASLAEQGRIIFTKETFRGNGRTCATCHVDGKDQFGLTPETIAALDHDDPLFVFEENINTVKLTTRSQPSDLRGIISGAGNSSGKIIGGSGDTYLVIGGDNLSGTLTDTNGNSGTFQTFTSGNLNGPTASNGSTRGLEDHELLSHGRGLILENIDGFDKPEVFRASPHLLNVAFTAPYGLSGEFSNLRDFSEGAVIQHFPRSMSRIAGLDFRPATPEELQAMEAFQNTIGNPPNADTNRFNLDLLVTTEAQKRGRQLFFSDQSKCFMCHSGPTLSQSDGSLAGTLAGRNDNFNTGIANLPMNLFEGHNLPTEPAGLVPGHSTRKFNTPPLFGIKLTAPYFHDGSASNLTQAIEFYDSIEFVASPDGVNVGAVIAANDPPKIADLVAFLEALIETPVDFTRELSFNVFCAGETPQIVSAVITNIGTNTLEIESFVINGTNAAEFQIASGNVATNVAPGATHSIEVAFQPQSLGHKNATLEITADDSDVGTFNFGVALEGAFMDNLVEISPLSLIFGTRDIDDPPSATQTVAIASSGTFDLEILDIALVGSNALDFQIITSSIPAIVPLGSTSFVEVVFSPQTQGTKSAHLRIESLACSNAVVQIALNGTATSTLDHFAWDNIPSPQSRDVPFPVRLVAQDRNGDTMNDFIGTVDLSATVSLAKPSSVLISEIDPGTPDAVEFINVSTQPVNLLNWRVTIFDDVGFPNPLTTFTITVNSNLPAGGRFTLTEGGVGPGTFPNFLLGANIFWTGASTGVAVLLRDAQSNIVDFVSTGPSLSITNPTAIPSAQWQNSGIPATAEDDVTSYQRTGAKDQNVSEDWVVAARNIGANNPGLLLPFPTNRVIAFSPDVSGNFSNGVWMGALTVFEEIIQVKVSADDGFSHSGIANLFNVAGTLPTISGLTNLAINEDTSTGIIPFTVADVEVAAENLVVTAQSSSTNLVSNANVILGGTNGNRTIRLIPTTNQFGASTITVSVSDGTSTNSDSFVLTVNPVNDAPVFAAIPNGSVGEQVLFAVTPVVTDADGTNDLLNFTLAAAPLGASIDPSTGFFSWTPTEADGPGTNLITIVVHDSGTPSLSATQSFILNVLEVNVAPVLAAISNKTIYVGNLFIFTNSATDADIPTNTLTFSLVTPPIGAGINSSNGVFTWTPNTNQANVTNLVRIRVADNGTPSLAVTQSFNLTVLAPPVNFVRTFDFGAHCSTNFTNTLSVTFTNTGSNSLVMSTALIKGTNAADFQIISDTGETNLAPGAVRQIAIGFAPQTFGNKQASLEITASENETFGNFLLNVSLTGSLSDSELQVSAETLNFGINNIDSLAFTTNTFVITNNGSANLQILSIELIGLDPVDPFNFQITSDSGQTNLLPGATRTLKIAFKPTRRGEKFAILEINSLACAGAFQEVFLAGTATSTLDRFGWNTIASPQAVNVPFQVQITAQDRNGDTILNHTNPIQISTSASIVSTGAVPILSFTRFADLTTEYPNTKGAISHHFTNFTETSTIETNASNLQTLLAGKKVFLIPEQETGTGQMGPLGTAWSSVLSNFVNAGGTVIVCSHATDEHQMLVNSGLLTVSKLSFGSTSLIKGVDDPLTEGVAVPFTGTDMSFYTNVGNGIVVLQTTVSNPVVVRRDIGLGRVVLIGTDFFSTNSALNRVIANAVKLSQSNFLGQASLSITPTNSGNFINGVWTGFVTVQTEARDVHLTASDGNGHIGLSNPFDVLGVAPVISSLADLSTDEDVSTPVLPFTISDIETAASNLLVTAHASNTNLVPLTNIFFTGTSSNRTVRILPATNQFGTSTINLIVSDGVTASSNSFVLTVNPINDPPTLPPVGIGFSENFDSVTAPVLPPGWTTTASGVGTFWTTTSGTKDSGSNSVFTSNPSSTSNSQLDSPLIPIATTSAQLTFRHSFTTESCCDGGFIEISINGGTFVNLTSAGGSFVTNGYNSGTSWRGNSGGFITSVANLPASAAGQNVQLRWRFTTDGSVGGIGWFVDTISITDSLSSLTINEDTVGTINTTVGDVETAVSNLILSATSTNTTLLPNENITFSGITSNRTITIRPATNQFGTTAITLSLSDGETNTMRTFPLTVVPVNDPPAFGLIGDKSVNEQTLLTITNIATDVETNAVTFSFVSTPLPFMALSSNGVFTWTPSETQGPAVHTISLRATDNGSPSLSVTQTFNILVREVNLAPTLNSVGGKTIHVGELLAFTNSATDPDFPANLLTFDLPSPPGNATIHPVSGLFTWTPTQNDLGTNVITLRVFDNGVPSLNDEKTVSVEVVSAPTIIAAEISGAVFTITWETIVEKKYRVQFKSALEDAIWTDLPGDVTADSSLESKSDTFNFEGQRYYRVILVP